MNELDYILCSCCHLCFEHCECDKQCPKEREFEECQPSECVECVECVEYVELTVRKCDTG